MCCTHPFCAGIALGMAAGVAVGMRLKGQEKEVRCSLRRAARTLEKAMDDLSQRC